MEALLHSIAHPIALAIQAVAIVFVTAGSALALVKAVRMLISGRRSKGEFQAIWLNHARWLVAGLTFLLAADIVETSFSPTWNELGRLAAVTDDPHVPQLLPRPRDGVRGKACATECDRCPGVIVGGTHERSD